MGPNKGNISGKGGSAGSYSRRCLPRPLCSARPSRPWRAPATRYSTAHTPTRNGSTLGFLHRNESSGPEIHAQRLRDPRRPAVVRQKSPHGPLASMSYVLADLRLHRYFNLRFSPGMSFRKQERPFHRRALRNQSHTRHKSVYVMLPLDLKVSGRPLFQLPSIRNTRRNGCVRRRQTPVELSAKFNTADAYLTIGLGCDFYLPSSNLSPR